MISGFTDRQIPVYRDVSEDNFGHSTDINGVVSRHVECVCLLDKNSSKPKDYVEIGVDAEDYYKIKDSEEVR